MFVRHMGSTLRQSHRNSEDAGEEEEKEKDFY